MRKGGPLSDSLSSGESVNLGSVSSDGSLRSSAPSRWAEVSSISLTPLSR